MTNRIKEWRSARSWSMQQLADSIGTTKSQISKLEKGERRLSQFWMERLAPALGCRPADLLPADSAEISAVAGVPVEVSAVIDSGMGGTVQPLELEHRYTLTFRPPASFHGGRFRAMVVEGKSHAAFPEGSELVFAEVSDNAALVPGKYVLLEEDQGDGHTQCYVGRLEASSDGISVIFQGKDTQSHRLHSFVKREVGSGGASESSVSRPSSVEIPLRSQKMRIAGLLIKSIKNE